MQLNVSSGTARQAQRPVQFFRLSANTRHRLRQRFALRVPGSQHTAVQFTAHRPAAHAGNTVIAGFFGQKVDNLKRMLQNYPLLMQTMGDFNPRQHADNPVIAAAAHHGIAMRTGHYRRQIVAHPGATTDQIAAFVQRYR
ncbi:hypothetical protein D3C72_1003540 [compost metagenome]